MTGKAEHCWPDPGTMQRYGMALPGLLSLPCCPSLCLVGSISNVLCFWHTIFTAVLGLHTGQAGVFIPSWRDVCRFPSPLWPTAAFTVPVRNPSSCKHFCHGLQHLCSPRPMPFAAESQLWLTFCLHSLQRVFALVSIVAKICSEQIIWALNDQEKPPSCTVALRK